MRILTFAVTSQDWTSLNETEHAIVEHNINNVQTEAFRRLAPDSGAYINEVCLLTPSLLSVEQSLTK